MNLTYSSLQNDYQKYDEKAVIKHIIICQNAKNDLTIQKNKLLLFKKMSKIIVANVDNYAFLTRNYEKKLLYEKDDIIIECYIIFDKCVSNFDLKRNLQFYFFLNKALRRGILKLVEKEFKHHHQDHYSKDEFQELMNESKLMVENQADFTFFYISKKLNLSIQEKKVAISRLRKQTIDEFITVNKDFTKITYYEILKNLKEKLKNFE